MLDFFALLVCAATALPAAPARAHTTINPALFQQVELAKGINELGEPMSIAVLPTSNADTAARIYEVEAYAG